jgi:response regulator NasT
MLRILFLSGSEDAAKTFSDCIQATYEAEILICRTVEQANRLLGSVFDLDLCIINAAHSEINFEAFALDSVHETQAQLLYLAPKERMAHLLDAFRSYGIMLLQKPITKPVLLSAIALMQAVQIRLRNLREEKFQLQRKLDDLKLVDRAKLVLIQRLGMTEAQAHRHLEKQAMDQQITKREAATNVLNVYEDRY